MVSEWTYVAVKCNELTTDGVFQLLMKVVAYVLSLIISYVPYVIYNIEAHTYKQNT